MKSFKLKTLALAVALGTAAAGSASAQTADSLTTFTAGTTAVAADVNANFSTLATAIDDNAAAIDAKQERVTGTCAADSAIDAINADGSVTCAAFPAMPLPQVVGRNINVLGGNTWTAAEGAVICATSLAVTVDYDTVAVVTGNFDHKHSTVPWSLGMTLVYSTDDGATWTSFQTNPTFATNPVAGWTSRTTTRNLALEQGKNYKFAMKIAPDSGDYVTQFSSNRCSLAATVY